MRKTFALLMAAILLLVPLAACGGETDAAKTPSAMPEAAAESTDAPAEPAPTVAPAEPMTLVIAAAASLEDSFASKLIPMFNEQYPNVAVVGTYDSSGKLQTQIEAGLEASVFMSAATKQMDALSEAGLIDATTVVPLLVNEIVLIAPVGSETGIDSFEKIGEANAVAIGDPASVPAGQYAQEALTSLGVWDAIQSKLSLGTNVTEVLNQVAEGSADVGIVYATDAAQMPDKVKVLAVAPEGSLAKPVVYPVGILANAPARPAAEDFVAFLQSPEALAVFVERGFKAKS